MPVNYDRAVSRAPVFDRAPNRDFERVRWYVSRPPCKPKPEDTVRVTEISTSSAWNFDDESFSVRVIRPK